MELSCDVQVAYSQLSLILTDSKHWRCVKYSPCKEVYHMNTSKIWYFDISLFFYKIKNRDEMEKRTETGLVMGHAYGVTAVKKVTSTFYLMVIGYSWSSSSSFKVLFTMMVNNTSKEKYNHFSHDVVTSDLSGLWCFNSILPVFSRQWGWTNKCSNPCAVGLSCDIILKIVTSLDMVCLILHSEEIFINTAIFSNWSQKKVTLQWFTHNYNR